MADIGISSSIEYLSGSSWIPIPKCKSIGVPGLTVNAVDSTNNDCTDYYKTYFPGTIDSDSISCNCEFTTDTYALLLGLVREITSFRVSSPDSDSATYTFDGFLTSLSSVFESENENMISFAIKITGDTTVA